MPVSHLDANVREVGTHRRMQVESRIKNLAHVGVAMVI